MTAIRDAALPALERAFSPEATATVREACLNEVGFHGASASRVELMKHVPGRRATLLYTFSDQTEASKRVVGKVYRSRRRAARMYRLLVALNGDVFQPGGVERVPQPLGLAEELHMTLHNFIDGADLRQVLDTPDPQPIALSARWLAHLHRSGSLGDLKVRTLEHEVGKSLHWLDRFSQTLQPDLQQRLERTRAWLAEVRAHPPAVGLRTIHRDYYYGNVLWDGERLWAIDLDELSLGDPALDVAHFLTHLEVLGYRTRGDFAAYNAAAEQFLAIYQQERPDQELKERLPIYRAYALLKLAATEAERGRPSWPTEVAALAAKACDVQPRV